MTGFSGDWRHRAACRNEDPELFCVPSEGDGYQDQIATAKAVCARCPVMSECAEWAMGAGSAIDSMIAAGMTTKEREALSGVPC